jgi:hypothetical protein
VDPVVAEAVGPSSGVWEWQRVDLLEPDSRRELCDWANARQGGYGRRKTCASGIVATDATPEACDAHLFVLGACGVKTADLEACVNVGETDLCASAASDACGAIRRCPASDGGPAPVRP